MRDIDRQVLKVVEERKLIVEEWKTVIQTQMHFNEMIMRARSTGVSVVIAVYGAAAIAFGQYPDRGLILCGYRFHVSAPILLFGLFLLLAIFVLDYFYYYQLLIGSVERGRQIDEAFRMVPIAGSRLFGLTSEIANRVSLSRARTCLWWFYGLPAFVGIISLVYVSFLYRFPAGK